MARSLLQRPILGARRRVEARIGQLIGEATVGSNQHSVMTEGSGNLDKHDRADFRILARGFEEKRMSEGQPTGKPDPEPATSPPGEVGERERQLGDFLPRVPVKYRQLVERATSGEASPRSAVKAHCLVCVGFVREEVTRCAVHRCPLWRYRPYQG